MRALVFVIKLTIITCLTVLNINYYKGSVILAGDRNDLCRSIDLRTAENTQDADMSVF